MLTVGIMRRRSSFRALQWLFPIAITIHNIEEAIWLPGFVVAHGSEVLWRVQPGEFRFALIVLTVAACIITYLSWRNGRQTVWAYLLFGCVTATLLNVFVPHVPAALVFGGYAPGVVTAVTINLPVMTWLLILAVRERWVSGPKAFAFGIGVPVGLALTILFFFAMSKS